MRNAEILLDILTEEVRLHERLLDLKSKERSELVGGKISDLDETILLIAETVDTIQSLESRRVLVTRDLGNELDLKTVSPTLKELAEMLPGKESREITEAGRNLKSVVGKVSKINSETKLLVSQSLDWINSLVGQLTGKPVGQTGYNAQGRKVEFSEPILLNQTL